MTNENLSLRKEVKLPVSPVVQDFNFDCGKAAVKTLLRSLGREVGDEILQGILRTNRVSGTHPRNILEAFRYFGLDFVEKVGSTIADIENMVKEGYYCLVVYQAWGSPEEFAKLDSGHYSLAYGYDEEAIHLADPAVTEEDGLGMGEGLRKVDKSGLYNDWKDQDYQGNLYDHWMVAVKG